MKKQNIFLFYSIFVMLTVYALMGIHLVIVTADSNGVDHFWSGSHFHTNRTSSYNIKKVAHDIFDIHADQLNSVKGTEWGGEVSVSVELNGSCQPINWHGKYKHVKGISTRSCTFHFWGSYANESCLVLRYICVRLISMVGLASTSLSARYRYAVGFEQPPELISRRRRLPLRSLKVQVRLSGQTPPCFKAKTPQPGFNLCMPMSAPWF